MTPTFKTLNSILCLTIAMHCQAEVYTSSNKAVQEAKKPLLEIATIIDNEEARRHLNLGLQNCLTGYHDKARYHFWTAVQLDDTNLLAHTGMLMVSPAGSSQYKHHLAQVNKLIGQVMLTPAEEWYLSTFLQYIAGDLSGAAQAFRERAALYRRDLMAACWDIVLNHYAAEQGGNLVSRAEKLQQEHPGNALVHYCRALLEEVDSTPSENALKAAQNAVELQPGIPPAQLLYGRFLSLTGRFDEALSHFIAARQTTEVDNEHIPLSEAATYRIAALSEITAYWQLGRKIDALKGSMALTRQLPAAVNGEGDILMHWEARTLPLRLLVLQPTAPAGAAINAAAKACNAPANDPLKLVQDCLVAAIQTRSLADSGRLAAATRTMEIAEQELARLQNESYTISRQGGLTFTCYQRSVRACQAALYRAKLSLYPDSKDIWKPYLDKLVNHPENRLLPPILPQLPSSSK